MSAWVRNLHRSYDKYLSSFASYFENCLHVGDSFMRMGYVTCCVIVVGLRAVLLRELAAITSFTQSLLQQSQNGPAVALLSVMKRKVKLELVDNTGDRLTLVLEGKLSRDKIIQIADLVELYGGGVQDPQLRTQGSKLDRVMAVVERYFPLGHFSSKDVMISYATDYHEPLSQSTASTYLARLADRGILQRTGSGNVLKYRINRSSPISEGKSVELQENDV